MMYLLARPACDRRVTLQFVDRKRTLYGCGLRVAEFSADGTRHVREIAGSEGFAREMKRTANR